MSAAVMLLKCELPTMEALLKETRDMDNFGWAVDPTLFRDSERRAASAVVTPLFEAAVEFVHRYNAHVAKAKDALAKVRA